MAFATTLHENKFSAIYDALQILANEALTKCVIKEGFFPNSWVKVLNLWTQDRLTNIAVYDMIANRQVCMLVESMDYQSTKSASDKSIVA